MRRWGRRGLIGAIFLGWAGFWFWVFSFAYSDSFFLYNRPARLPVLFAAWLGACAILASAIWQWRRQGRRRGSILAACLRHAIGVALSLCPLLVVSAVLRRAPPPWRPSADDAMGTGIDFLILCGLGIVSVAVLALALSARRISRGRQGVLESSSRRR